MGTNNEDIPATSHGAGSASRANFTGWGMPQGYASPAAKLLKGYADYPAGSPSKPIPAISPFINANITATGPLNNLTEGTAYRLPADLALNSSDSSILALDLSTGNLLGSPSTILPRSVLATQAYNQGTFYSANFYAYYLDNAQPPVPQPVFGATPSATNNIQSLWTGSVSDGIGWPQGLRGRGTFTTNARQQQSFH